MTADSIRELLNKQPFEPFQMRMPDGRVIPVPHPDFISMAPTGRIAVVWKGEGEQWWHVDVRQVSDVESMDKKAKRKR